MRVRAFAKINRSLRVLGTRADGYHELRTIFQSIALHDTLTVRPARGGFVLTCDDPACPTDESNLVARAAARMWAAAGRRGAPSGLSIHLRKRIPMQAGLGGGSSDAAATLRILAKRWRVGDPKVRAAAAALGSDVPYFLEGGTALGLERGDLLFPLNELASAWVVLVIPAFGVSTSEAFGWFDALAEARGFQPSGGAQSRGGRSPERLALREPERLALAEMVNDLEAPVAEHHPEIARIISALRRGGATQAAMSGSGSAVFGLFSSRQPAATAAARLSARSFRTLLTRTLNRQTYQKLAAT
jgi:4-diphosphocytidyl-2-C-methyl-D-erythritol kinase